MNLLSNLRTRLAHNILGLSNPNWRWQNSTISILLVLNSFMNKRFTAKSVNSLVENVVELIQASHRQSMFHTIICCLHTKRRIRSSDARSCCLSQSCQSLFLHGKTNWRTVATGGARMVVRLATWWSWIQLPVGPRLLTTLDLLFTPCVSVRRQAV